MKIPGSFALLTGSLLAGCSGGDRPPTPAAPPPAAINWRALATPADRERLRGWRTAWMTALTRARAAGFVREVSAQGALLDPDRVLDRPVPPPGRYRCRIIKLGAQGVGLDYVAYPAFACDVDKQGDVVTFRKSTGSQRPVGTIYPGNGARAVFLGTLMLSDEARAMDYGVDASRDMAGFVERIGDRRWRLVLPYPRFESTLDVVEITPAG